MRALLLAVAVLSCSCSVLPVRNCSPGIKPIINDPYILSSGKIEVSTAVRGYIDSVDGASLSVKCVF